jgi:hypothetical protein
METFIYRREDNSVALGLIAPNVVDGMVGGGGLIPLNEVERAIAKQLLVTDNQAEFTADLQRFLDGRKGSTEEVAAREYIEGLAFGGLTRLEALRRIAANDRPDDCVECSTIDHTERPDYYFRDAFEKLADKPLAINMDKARAIHLDIIRHARNQKLAALDAPFLIALESGDVTEQRRIREEKQILRDIPQTFDLTTRNSAQLKSKWPEELTPETS